MMTLQQAREHIGDGVIYRPHPGAPAEDGEIVSVNDAYVFVRYRDRFGVKATCAEDLTLLNPGPSS